jgi:periplasmic protein TonB
MNSKKLLFLLSILIASLQLFAQKIDISLSKKKALRDVEQNAEFQGGMRKLSHFLQDNLNFPRTMQDEGLSGKTEIEFVVCEDGSICNVKIVNSAGPLFDKEAMRVVQKMPKWTPGK